MSSLWILVKQEFILQNRINNMIKYLVAFFLFCTISTILINSQDDIQKFGLIFSVICLLISLISFSPTIFKHDLTDGTLELLLTTFTYEKIILAKFFAIFISAIMAVTLALPVIYIFFNQTVFEIVYFFLSVSLLLALASSLVILSSSMQSYFRFNNNFLSIFMMPLLIPDIIMTGLIMQNNNMQLIFIMIGINLIFLPISLILTTYLLKNTYNI